MIKFIKNLFKPAVVPVITDHKIVERVNGFYYIVAYMDNGKVEYLDACGNIVGKTSWPKPYPTLYLAKAALKRFERGTVVVP